MNVSVLRTLSRGACRGFSTASKSLSGRSSSTAGKKNAPAPPIYRPNETLPGTKEDLGVLIGRSEGNKQFSAEGVPKTSSLLGAKFQLPTELLLQSLTHKTFVNGLKPFNEKLSFMGLRYLKLRGGLYAIHNGKSFEHDVLVNGLNFDAIVQAENLFHPSVLHKFAQLKGIDREIFWCGPHPDKPVLGRKVTKSAEYKDDKSVRPSYPALEVHCKEAVTAIVGAVLYHHGDKLAREFVDEVLMNGQDETSLIGIYRSVLAQRKDAAN